MILRSPVTDRHNRKPGLPASAGRRVGIPPNLVWRCITKPLALTLLAGVVLAPELNPSLNAPLWSKITAGAVAGLCELAAFSLLAYIPTTPPMPVP